MAARSIKSPSEEGLWLLHHLEHLLYQFRAEVVPQDAFVLVRVSSFKEGFPTLLYRFHEVRPHNRLNVFFVLTQKDGALARPIEYLVHYLTCPFGDHCRFK